MTIEPIEECWRRFYAISACARAADFYATSPSDQETRETLAGLIIAIGELARAGDQIASEARDAAERTALRAVNTTTVEEA